MESITNILNEDMIKNTIERGSEFMLIDSAVYYFNEIERIGSEDYIPNEQDVLRSRQQTTAVIETFFEVNNTKFKLVDVGGQKSLRRKWIHFFEGVNAVLFCAALSDYDMTMREDNEKNRMIDSIELFAEICNNQYFVNTDIILFLNKVDLFEEKIKKVPLTVCFSEYTGENYKDAINFITGKYTSKNRNPDKYIFPHNTCATSTENMEAVFKAIRNIIVKQNMQSQNV